MACRIAGLLAGLLALTPQVLAKDWESPEYKWLYQYPLPIPPVKQPQWPNAPPFYHPNTGKPIQYYELVEKEFSQRVYPDKGNATLRGYDGMSPGPTIIVEKGFETMVRVTNRANMATSCHLHGSYSRAPFDGWAEDLTEPGEYKDYYYPNSQSARMLWYHDHAIDHTAENAYYGLAGAYIIHDPAEDALNLPSGYGQYDIPLVLSSKQYRSNGQLFSPAGETDSLYGDVIQVNGQPWPFFNVEPRKYRLRFLNAAISRTFFLYFERSDQTGKKLPFDVIASDSGLLSGPARVNDLYISMAERYEIVIDFAPYKGKKVTLRNTDDFSPDKEYLHTNKVMQFVVSNNNVVDNSEVKSSFRTIPWPPNKTTVDKKFKFERSGGQWTINGVTFLDVKNRIMSKPPRGTVEVWELENSSGGWSHPIHIHLVDFQVIKRTGGRGLMPYETAGLKDVVWLGPGETVTVRAHYAPFSGLYMFHCHNLIHEDHAMMAAFNVTNLEEFGYDETDYVDPMEARWRSRKVTDEESSYDWCKQRTEYMASLQPYNKVEEIEDRLDEYWMTRGKTTSTKTSTTSSSTSTSYPTSTTTYTTTTPPVTTTTKSTTTKTTSSTKATTTKKDDDKDKDKDKEKEEKEKEKAEKEKEKEKEKAEKEKEKEEKKKDKDKRTFQGRRLARRRFRGAA